MGISRSPTVVCAYLVAHRGMSPHQALEYVVSRRAIVHPNAGFLRQLNIFANRLRGSKKLRRPGLPPPPPPVRVTVTRSMTEVERYGAGWGRPGPQSQPHSHSRDGRPPPPGQMMTRRGSMGP